MLGEKSHAPKVTQLQGMKSPTVCIGLGVKGAVEQFATTIANYRSCTQTPAELFFLTDRADATLTAAIPKTCDAPQSTLPVPPGGAARFNQLAQASTADVIVLLESGCAVSPGWLERLLAALAVDPRNGLAGPSTNRSWNQQGVFPRAGGTDAEVARTAREAARRFGRQVRTLEPLYSLADFCYAVRREVIDEIGLADEGYGLGPCWEMDYNIRAARAGWRGVWACGAYVWRAPASDQGNHGEADFFEASKRRYQDKFCGARLRGVKHDYRSHCRGDACPNFAPLEFRKLWLPGALPNPSIEVKKPSIETVESGTPLVSCIMPTCNRRPFVPGAIRNFLNQDYPNLELLIVDDGTDRVEDLAPADPRIRYLRLDQKKILGDKRNFACQQARGTFIAHWDDDDWYPPDRISRQISALLSSKADVCGTSAFYFCDTAMQRAWLYSYAFGSRGWVGGTTLAYTRSFWERVPFPSLQVGEDTRFVWADKKARVCDLKEPGLCVARIHPGNTCRKATGGSCWRPVAISEIQRVLGPALDAFRSPGTANFPPMNASEQPLISCIMPTANRRDFVRRALEYFQQQDYQPRELIVVDDGQEDLSDMVAGLGEVTYLRLSKRVTIGAKRNLACQKARGNIIAHWDDDDWYAPTRLSFQAAPIIQNEADITGLDTRFIFDLGSRQCWTVTPGLHRRMFVGDVHGGTLMFRKTIFDAGTCYPNANIAEDAAFLRVALRSARRLLPLSNPDLFVYVRHGTNAWKFASGKFLDAAGWQPIAAPAAFLAQFDERDQNANHDLLPAGG